MKRLENLRCPQWVEVVGLFFVSRLLILIIGAATLAVVGKGNFFSPREHFRDAWAQWDANWYLGIARDGYTFQSGSQSTVAFFPFFPMAMRILGPVFGGPENAGLVISNVALLGAILAIWRMTPRVFGREVPEGGESALGTLPVALLLFGPVSLFFSIGYSESCFLCFSACSILAAISRRWILAGTCGLLAALTRNAGVLLVVPLLMEFFQVSWTRPFIRWEPRWWRAWPCLLPIVGLLIWLGWLAWRFEDPFIFMKVQSAWGRQLTWPWIAFIPSHLGFPPFYNVWFVAHALVGIGLAVVLILFRVRPALTMFGLLSLLLCLSANHLESIPRYLSVIFPFYFAAAEICRRRSSVAMAWIATSAALLAFSVVLFVGGYWFT